MFRKVYIKSLKDVNFTRFFLHIKAKRHGNILKQRRKPCCTEKCSIVNLKLGDGIRAPYDNYYYV